MSGNGNNRSWCVGDRANRRLRNGNRRSWCVGDRANRRLRNGNSRRSWWVFRIYQRGATAPGAIVDSN